LISELNCGASFFHKIFGRVLVKIVDLPGFNATIYAVVLPFNASELEKMPVKRRAKFLNKALRIFKKNDIKSIIYTREVKKIFSGQSIPTKYQGFSVFTGKGVFHEFVPEAVRRIMNRKNMSNLNMRLGISDRAMSIVTEYLVKNLCYDSKYIKIYTENLNKANELEDKVYNETGLALQISPLENRDLYKSDIFIDVDELKIRMGRDLSVDGFVPVNVSVPGFDIDPMDLVECLGLRLGDIKIKCLTSGDKILTI
jgi:hypothetical protein